MPGRKNKTELLTIILDRDWTIDEDNWLGITCPRCRKKKYIQLIEGYVSRHGVLNINLQCFTEKCNYEGPVRLSGWAGLWKD